MHIDLIDKRLFKKRKSCSICYLDFSFFKGQYHCYVCASSVCWDCSSYSINKMRYIKDKIDHVISAIISLRMFKEKL